MKEKGEREGERREKGRKEKKGERKGKEERKGERKEKEERKGERKGEEERKRCKCFFFLVSDSNDTILTNLASSTDEKVKYYTLVRFGSQLKELLCPFQGTPKTKYFPHSKRVSSG